MHFFGETSGVVAAFEAQLRRCFFSSPSMIGHRFNLVQDGPGEFPILERINRCELPCEHNQPEHELVPAFGAFMPQPALREKSTRPASQQIQKMQLRFRDAPLTVLRAPFVAGICPISDHADGRQIGSYPSGVKAAAINSDSRQHQQANKHRNTQFFKSPTIMANCAAHASGGKPAGKITRSEPTFPSLPARPIFRVP